MKQYLLYIVNSKSGTCRNLTINAKDSSHARILAEQCCLRSENEKILCSYCKDKETAENGI